MKEVSERLEAHLSTEKSFMSCDLYELTLQNGATYRWADADIDVVYRGYVFKGDGPIISRNKIATHSAVNVDKLSVTISCGDHDTIGDMPIMAIAHNGGLDGSTMKLSRAFFDHKTQLVDAVDLFTGIVEVAQGGGIGLKLNVKSVVQRLNIEWPCKRYYPQCPYVLYGKECGVDVKSYRKKMTVKRVVDTNTVAIDISFADGYYNAGGIEWLTGPLVGQNTQVMTSASGVIRYVTPNNVLPRVGDQGYIYPGCDKTPQTCRAKFNNFSRNRATPYVPLKETIR